MQTGFVYTSHFLVLQKAMQTYHLEIIVPEPTSCLYSLFFFQQGDFLRGWSPLNLIKLSSTS